MKSIIQTRIIYCNVANAVQYVSELFIHFTRGSFGRIRALCEGSAKRPASRLKPITEQRKLKKKNNSVIIEGAFTSTRAIWALHAMVKRLTDHSI